MKIVLIDELDLIVPKTRIIDHLRASKPLLLRGLTTEREPEKELSALSASDTRDKTQVEPIYCGLWSFGDAG